MTNEEISLRTKQSLADALKLAMTKKPLSKVTITELIEACNINRKTFYYHFEDKYDLLKWMLEQEAIEVVKSFDLLTDAEEAIDFVMQYVEENHHIITCAYDSMGHDEIKRFFFTDFVAVFEKAIQDGTKTEGIEADEEFKQFVATFFAEACAGIMMDWLKKNLGRQETEVLRANVLLICKVSIPEILRAKAGKTLQ